MASCFGSVRAVVLRTFTRLRAMMGHYPSPGWFKVAMAISTERLREEDTQTSTTELATARCFGSAPAAPCPACTHLPAPPAMGRNPTPRWCRVATAISTGQLETAGQARIALEDVVPSFGSAPPAAIRTFSRLPALPTTGTAHKTDCRRAETATSMGRPRSGESGISADLEMARYFGSALVAPIRVFIPLAVYPMGALQTPDLCKAVMVISTGRLEEVGRTSVIAAPSFGSVSAVTTRIFTRLPAPQLMVGFPLLYWFRVAMVISTVRPSQVGRA